MQSYKTQKNANLLLTVKKNCGTILNVNSTATHQKQKTGGLKNVYSLLLLCKPLQNEAFNTHHTRKRTQSVARVSN